MSDELTITWPTISDTLDPYIINFDPTATNTTLGTFSYTTTPNSASQSNAVWTTNTTTGSNPQFTNWNIGNSNIMPSGQIHLTGDNADIVVNGQSLNATLTAIQERMGMLVPNPEVEAEWDQLRELGERYRELEKLCKEKSTVWNKLKKI